ncbi:MAG: 50S ribosomal protein L9 [Omnitrophica WOR_2 bacterium RIFCSPLOWO2_12_FULL_51_24]|nr:MAG: 50S ribosomal protein L9 [Omnitrophica WOR_2 bacterium RIFCSPHIGHO2_01_FULL_49_10]OGX32984.1 MAG: 50S ribosomal protein L9 [Omnitrophica WOR_2 bacterium RIFCSPLOWO2_02_FULL_50_19]OGX41487.1 MAG: 50S ribosomal protein L9 [Omnitrophica WOR_2 bacterium RIFCSPLOWO2_12_FULL_51_24]
MATKIILLKDVDNLGKSGDVVSASEGYARNFLFPRGIALSATEQNIKVAEANRKQKTEAMEKEKQEAAKIADAISKISCTIAVEAGKDDKLFGSVTSSDIQKALEAEGINIDKKKVELKDHITQIGIFQIPIKLHQEITANLKLWVVKK